jgi:hypothetical protein
MGVAEEEPLEPAGNRYAIRPFYDRNLYLVRDPIGLRLHTKENLQNDLQPLPAC